MFSHWDNSGATKDYHRATDQHLGPVKPSGTTGKSLIVLNPRLSLNQRVPGSSPGAPTKQSSQNRAFFQDTPHSGAFCGGLRPLISWILVCGKCPDAWAVIFGLVLDPEIPLR